jgi:hypothetical protein
MPDDIAPVCCEGRNKTVTNGDLRCVNLNSTQVLAYNRVDLSTERRDLRSFSPEACDRLQGHRVRKVDGGLYWQILLDGNNGH